MWAPRVRKILLMDQDETFAISERQTEISQNSRIPLQSLEGDWTIFIGHFAAFQRNIFDGGMLKKQIGDYKPASWKGNCNILQVHTPKITYTSWLLFSLQHTVNNVLCRSPSNKAFKCIFSLSEFENHEGIMAGIIESRLSDTNTCVCFYQPTQTILSEYLTAHSQERGHLCYYWYHWQKNQRSWM